LCVFSYEQGLCVFSYEQGLCVFSYEQGLCASLRVYFHMNCVYFHMNKDCVRAFLTALQYTVWSSINFYSSSHDEHTQKNCLDSKKFLYKICKKFFDMISWFEHILFKKMSFTQFVTSTHQLSRYMAVCLPAWAPYRVMELRFSVLGSGRAHPTLIAVFAPTSLCVCVPERHAVSWSVNLFLRL